MIGSSFLDDIETDLGGDFFDHIDDLLDFPMEDIEGVGVGGDCDAFQGVWPPPPSDILAGSTSNLFSTGKNYNNTPTDNNCNRSISEVPTELSVPYEDIAQLEWLSNFVEDSFSAGSITVEKDSSDDNKETHPFQTSSPVSVLESSSSCSGGSGGGGRAMPLSPDTFVPGRARSKRPRPATFNPRPVIPLISPTSSMTEPTPQPFSAAESQFEFENYAESLPSKKIQKPVAIEQQKMKKKKKKLPPLAGGTEQSAAPQAVAIRKCLHCEITKTPQWRAGPLGPKTLCNACGVRYKSGRLFPEYRPAASPTFVASLHSNSHKKVVEMRNKVGHKPVTASTVTATAAVPELVPNRSYLFDYNI